LVLLLIQWSRSFTALPMTTEGGQQAAIDQNVKGMEAFGVEVTDELYAGMQRSAKSMPYTTGGAVLVMVPIMSVIIAAILFGIFAVMGGGATFKQLFAVYVHAGLISTVGSVFTGRSTTSRGDDQRDEPQCGPA
jgi:hypothetical protein